jgi:hydroxypyruvate isomerase
MNRKEAIQKIGIGTASLMSLPMLARSFNQLDVATKNSINHSVCQWCFSYLPLEELVLTAKSLGIKSIDLLRQEDWRIAVKHGLTCAMGYASTLPLTVGFNDVLKHGQLLKEFATTIPKAAEAGIKNLICFSGNTQALTRQQGLENCARGLEPILKIAAQYDITVSMELLNSKVDHADYQCDSTQWGVELCEKLGSDNFKLLYDIYHMQIMEGNVIATINKCSKYISHYHTAGVPGRHEIDETQELNYPAIMQAIVSTGFKGFVAQEFIPIKPNKIDSLKKAVELCNV